METTRGRILVTGGAGFIGTHLVRALVARGEQVVVLDALTEQVHQGKPWTPPTGVELVQGDVRDVAAVRRCLEGVDRVVHLAAETGVGQSAYEMARYVDVNERGTAVLLEECGRVASQLRGVVLGSSRAIYGEGRYRCEQHGDVYPRGRRAEDLAAGRWEPRCPECGEPVTPLAATEAQHPQPTSVYAVTKLNQEHLVACFAQATGVPCTILRFQNVYGPGQALGNPYTGILSIFATRLLNGNAVDVYEDGLPSRDFVYVGDVVQAVELSLRGGAGDRGEVRTYNVGSGHAHSILEIAQALCAALGCQRMLRLSGKYRVGDIRHAQADLRRPAAELGYAPAVELHDGLRRFVAWVQAEVEVEDRYEQMEQEMASRGLLAAAGR